ncbi:MAG: glycine zipper 2TM domain-containing protein [Chloroflexi bacterium]|nr:MAG: glycine zipper 2TM domain-containing protein [Chloroflexota bacterium]
MSKSIITSFAVAALLLAAIGCKDLPGTPGQQGAAVGGVSGAAAGALIGGSEHRLLGALLGGAIGAGGGYLIGANSDRITGKDHDSAQEAVRQAQASPATPEQARQATTADLNSDGFVTMDEVVAMERAGYSDQQILDRMRATDQVFELTTEQQNYLRSNGVSQHLIDQMPDLNREVRDRVLSQTGTAVPPATGQTPYPPSPTTPVPPPPGP